MNTTIKPLNIFIVDDDKLFRTALIQEIENAFNKVPKKIVAFDAGETCLEKINNCQPDIVILDFFLNSKYPDAMNGLSILNQIKRKSPTTEIIMLTANDNVDTALKTVGMGAFDYIIKTKTVFRKVNNAIYNILKVISLKKEKKQYDFIMMGAVVTISFLLGVILAFQFLKPGF